MYCKYYRAHVNRPTSWFVVAILRSFEHMAFDRTYSKQDSIFEFFVPYAQDAAFCDLMRYFQEKAYVSDLQEMPNRLINEPLNH